MSGGLITRALFLLLMLDSRCQKPTDQEEYEKQPKYES